MRNWRNILRNYPEITFGFFTGDTAEKDVPNLRKTLSEKYKKTPGQIILNWHINAGVIPIPGTSKPTRTKENLGSTEFKMEESEYQSLSDLCVKEFRFCDGRGIYGIDVFA